MAKLTANNVKFTRSVGTTTYEAPTVIPTYTDATYLRRLENPSPYDNSLYDNFGIRISASNNYVAVSATSEQNAEGKVYVFNKNTGTLLYTLDNPSTYSTNSLDDLFGSAISMSDTYLIIGVHRDYESQSGVMYIFDVTNGNLLHTVLNPNSVSTPSSDNFGYQVSISGTNIAVSALQERYINDTLYQAGVVYIVDAVSGTVTRTIHNPNPYDTPNDSFGVDVALYGNKVIVGASSEDESGAVTSGKAYIFDIETGSLLHTLDNPNHFSTPAGDEFGRIVAIGSNYAMVSAPSEDSSTNTSIGSNAGVVYVYDVDTGNLLHSLENPNNFSTPLNDGFGKSPQNGHPMAINGKYGFIGAPYEDIAGNDQSGAAYMFDLETGTLVKTLLNPNLISTAANDRFGTSVASYGDLLAVSANYEQSAVDGYQSGAVYLYQLS